MQIFRRFAALCLALCLIVSLAGCGGKTNKDALSARFTVLYRTDFLRDYLADPNSYADEIASFGVDDFAKIFADPDAFHCYNAEIAVGNENDFGVSILALQVDKNAVGKGGVWLSMLDDGASVGLPAHFSGDNAMYYAVIADASLSDDQVLKALSAQKAKLLYVDSASGADTLAEAADTNTKILESVISFDK